VNRWVPEPWSFVLLALACFRATRLIGWDSISEPLRKRMTGYTDAGAPTISDTQRRKHGKARVYFSTLVRCPWCIGTYVCLAAYGLWLWHPLVAFALSVPAALGAVTGLVAKTLDA
jgi:hypothetical protein